MENEHLFWCRSCGNSAIQLYRWKELKPISVCGSCGHTAELDTEELNNMIIHRRICDRPGCGEEIPEGTGGNITIALLIPAGDEETTREQTLNIAWDLCDECMMVIDTFLTDEDRMGRTYGGIKRSLSMRGKPRKSKGDSDDSGESATGDPPDDPPAAENPGDGEPTESEAVPIVKIPRIVDDPPPDPQQTVVNRAAGIHHASWTNDDTE